jgi:hypothetical protein
VAAVLPLAALAGGCVTLDCLRSDDEPPPPGTPCQVVAWWQPHVVFAPDPARNGVSAPGLAGRLYLFGQEVGFPMVGDGSVVVDLYDETNCPAGRPAGQAPGPPAGQAGAQPVLQEEWRIDPVTLKRLLRRDRIGWGYTLFLPWGRYRPDLTRVQLRVRYVPDHGSPVFAEPTSVNLSADGSPTGPPVVTAQAGKLGG